MFSAQHPKVNKPSLSHTHLLEPPLSPPPIPLSPQAADRGRRHRPRARLRAPTEARALEARGVFLFADTPPFPHMSHPVSPICHKLILFWLEAMRLGQLGRDESSHLERELTSFERELTREPRATASRASSLGGPVEAGRGGGTPAGVTPAGVTPAGVTPAGVTPGGLTRTSSFGRHIQRRTASFGRATGVRRAPSVARAASAGSFVEPSYPGSSRERSTRYRDLDSRSRDLELELERQFSQMMGSDEIETRGEAISRDQTASLSSSFSSQPAASVRPAATREVKCLNPPPPTPPRPFGRICSHRVPPMEPHAPPPHFLLTLWDQAGVHLPLPALRCRPR